MYVKRRTNCFIPRIKAQNSNDGLTQPRLAAVFVSRGGRGKIIKKGPCLLLLCRAMKACWLAILFAASSWSAECRHNDQLLPEAQEKFQSLDRRAQIEFRQGEFAKAAEDFQRVACLVPESARSYYGLYAAAVTALAASDFARANDALARADQLRPDYPLALAMMVKVSLLSGDIEPVRRSLRVLAERFPNDDRLHANLAQDLLHAKQNDLALAESLRVAKSAHTDPKFTLNLAVLENGVGAARDSLKHALSVEEQAGVAQDVRASAAAIAGRDYESVGELEQAIPHLSVALRLAPHEENAYLALARILEAQHKSEAAMSILQHGRKQNPDSSRLSLTLAGSLISAGQYSASAQLLNELIEKFPNELEAYPRLAEAYRGMSEPVHATEVLRRLAARDPEFPMIHVVIAQSMLDEESIDYAAVLSELDYAEKASSEDSDVYYLRGKAFMALQKYSQATAALRRAIELQPTNSRAYYQLGLAYQKAGKAQLAKEEFDRIHFLKNEAILPK